MIFGKKKLSPQQQLDQKKQKLSNKVTGIIWNNVWSAKKPEDREKLKTRITELLQQGASLSYRNGNDAKTAVETAAYNGYQEFLDFLIEKGAPVTADILTESLKGCSSSKVPEYIMEKYPDLVHQQDRNGDTALTIYTQYRNAGGIKKVLAMQADVAVKNNEGASALAMTVNHRWGEGRHISADDLKREEECIIELFNAGAKFEDAIFYWQTKGAPQKAAVLQAYQKKLTGLDEVCAAELLKTVKEQAAQITRLEEQVKKLTPSAPPPGL